MSFNNFNEQQNTNLTMTPEEEKTHKSFFSKICFCVLTYIFISQVMSVALAYFMPELLKSNNSSIIASSAIQYLIAFPIFYWMIKGIPVRSAPQNGKLSIRDFLKYTAATVFLMYVGNYISVLLMSGVEGLIGTVPENSIDTLLTKTDYLISAVLVGIVGPIIEELMFRKLLIDRLLPYGEKVAVIFPSFIFALVHGNLYQFFYAFLIGIALSYIYVKTGKTVYTVIIHCFINLFFGVFAAYVTSLLDLERILELSTDEALFMEYIEANIESFVPYTLYIIVFYALLLAGLVSFNRMIYRFRFEKGSVTLPKGKALEITTFNAGAIALITACVALIALNTFSV